MEDKKPIQSIIPPKVVKIAKAMIEARASGQQLIVMQRRQSGLTMANKLANGEQVLPTSLYQEN